MITRTGTFIIVVALITGCASNSQNTKKSDTSEFEKNRERSQTKSFNQFHHDWDY
ncbi:MAG: hypothetical protein Q7U04_09905 [Bacteriovorax sp.]|nr:hypothetical protein [Bacteriovorax sp.]